MLEFEICLNVVEYRLLNNCAVYIVQWVITYLDLSFARVGVINLFSNQKLSEVELFITLNNWTNQKNTCT